MTKTMAQPTVKERPILFSAEMIRALLDGRKTMTRRVMKPQPSPGFLARGLVGAVPQWPQQDGVRFFMADGLSELVKCPYGGPGNNLWVREKWQQIQQIGPREFRTVHRTEQLSWARPIYAATDDGDEPPRWMPSIHMPRWASRITLEIESVRVERVQDISEADATAEGVEFLSHPAVTARSQFEELWDKVNGKGAWERNDWVWVIAFRRLEAT